jgi:hypothetical protein
MTKARAQARAFLLWLSNGEIARRAMSLMGFSAVNAFCAVDYQPAGQRQSC